ncbi:hypothetical protein VTK73DRAFT_7517 [Phialemonium thermophilum]|uniref:MARVEL domain-containing protein n=1 Tax=Phialemonium thermophilum TaxID=223376 RepID=A0ABR3WE31_9PEZI
MLPPSPLAIHNQEITSVLCKKKRKKKFKKNKTEYSIQNPGLPPFTSAPVQPPLHRIHPPLDDALDCFHRHSRTSGKESKLQRSLMPLQLRHQQLTCHQTLFGVTILGLSVSLYKEQYYGHAPVTTKYSIFLGAFAVILGFVGALSLFVEPIPAVVPMAFDAVGGLLLLAGGIVSGCNPTVVGRKASRG